MKTTSHLLAGCLLLAFVPDALRAQPDAGAQTAPPATQPATTTTAAAPPYKITIPPGFKLLTINGRRLVVEPADEPWVTSAMGKLAATTQPATQPAQLLARLSAQRTAILTDLARDLALSDLTRAAATYDGELTSGVRRLDEYQPPIYYLVIAPPRLTEIMRSGWSDPRFYYNRAADAVTFNPAGALNIDRQDDVIFPAVYDPGETPEKRGENLTVAVGSTEASVAASVDIRARQHIGGTFAQLVNEEGLEPLELKEDQAWFQLGVANYLGAKYASAITGEKRDALNEMLTFEHPQHPLKTTAIDLLHPTDLKTMRPEALPAYFDTVRRKSTRAVKFLTDQAGEKAIPLAILAIRAKKPADGEAMVKVIQEATGVDVTPQLVRGR